MNSEVTLSLVAESACCPSDSQRSVTFPQVFLQTTVPLGFLGMVTGAGLSDVLLSGTQSSSPSPQEHLLMGKEVAAVHWCLSVLLVNLWTQQDLLVA